ncbi:hypothetical protein PXH80_33700, partial [Mycolicibacterium smegmatis]|nr:hypothetical protein [Mycolicibacterium smegmatis]
MSTTARIPLSRRRTRRQAAPQGDERRFTAPSSFDGSTQKIDTPPDPETEVFAPPPGDPNKP